VGTHLASRRETHGIITRVIPRLANAAEHVRGKLRTRKRSRFAPGIRYALGFIVASCFVVPGGSLIMYVPRPQASCERKGGGRATARALPLLLTRENPGLSCKEIAAASVTCWARIPSPPRVRLPYNPQPANSLPQRRRVQVPDR
jgi:hypothetical protein